ASAAELLRSLDDAGGHRSLGFLAPDARVVELLVPDLAVDLEDAVVVLEHEARDRAREGVLRVGVDVHLDDTVGNGRGDLLRGRAGAAVEDEVERLRARAVLGGDAGLDLTEELGAELDRTRLVDAV